MRRRLVLLLGLCVGCGAPSTSNDAATELDAGALDAGPGDAGLEDAGVVDAGTASDGGVLVTTNAGVVVGTSDGGVVSFLGIPYAHAPVGPLRWRPPEAATPWAHPRDATAFGPSCPQDTADAGFAQSEDCLFVNVWSPRVSPTARLPVMVFIHGGGFKNGSGSRATYVGSTLPTHDVLLVTFNYRLGNLGFLAHPLLTQESAHASSGNYGFLDQIAALNWVHDNIEAFGGDPSNVTLFGESAGSISTCLHVFAPASRGLFKRGLGESGSCVLTARPLSAAENLGATFVTATACTTLECLRSLTVEQITRIPAAPDNDFGLGVANPNVDGWVLPEAPAAALAQNHVNPVDAYVGGVNRDEATLFTLGHTIDSEAELRLAIQAIVPHHVDEALALYPLGANYPTYKAVYDALSTDLLFVCPTKQLLDGFSGNGITTYLYRFMKETAAGKALGLGVYHGSELPFVFGTGQLLGPAKTLSNQMQSWWSGFATNGAPGTPWATYVAGSGSYLNIDDQFSMQASLRSTECEALTLWLKNP